MDKQRQDPEEAYRNTHTINRFSRSVLNILECTPGKKRAKTLLGLSQIKIHK